MPGERELVYVAGHRTTYGAPFGEHRRAPPGDTISRRAPVRDRSSTASRAIGSSTTTTSRSSSRTHREELVLQACHPRFFASQRYLVYARPVSVSARARFRMADGWESVRLDEIEPISVVDGTLLWRPVRRTLDIGAFGINAYVAPNAGDDVVEEHTERSLGHEEVYVVLTGRATFTLDDESARRTGRHRRLHPRPDVSCGTRAPRSRGRQVLAVGGPRGRGVRAVALGGLLRGGAASHRRGLRRVSRRARGRARTAARSPGERCTTSRARRRWSGRR